MDIPAGGVRALCPGHMDESFDTWLSCMLLDNNLFHFLNPEQVAPAEQMAFMVHMEPGHVYLPCSDRIFAELCADEMPDYLMQEYERGWRSVMRMLESLDLEPERKSRIARFCGNRYQAMIREHRLIPSRMDKRLSGIVLLNCASADPWFERRASAIAHQYAAIKDPHVAACLDRMDTSHLPASINGIAQRLVTTYFARFACLSANTRRWSKELPPASELKEHFTRAEKAFEACPKACELLGSTDKTVLICADADGGSIYDLHLAQILMRGGNRVIYAVKDGFYFHAPTLRDISDNPILRQELADTHLCTNPAISKNELLRLLREWGLVVISDGTRERLNLARTSVTFARAWKESDYVVMHGWRLRETFLGSSYDFTRDILCFSDGPEGFSVAVKPHAKAVRKFSQRDIEAFSDEIIAQMREARSQGKTVMFYSCIVGSIPGQTATAIRMVTAFLQDLRQRMPSAWIINPAEHFVEGMDGDDLMYMWERVQRSGLIAVWRFQTTEDIERGFALLGESVPMLWMGKDSTFSTGCTKEMRIAQDVQRKNPEMTILGPAPEGFFRRSDYGVGKYFDATLRHN